MKQQFILFLLFLSFFACSKKATRQKELIHEIMQSRALGTFSRFSEDYYFWSEKASLQNAALSLIDLKDQNGQNLSGRYKVSYGIYDDILEDTILPSTLTTENIAFFEGTATFIVDLEDLLTRGNLQSKEGWFWLEFIFYDRENKEVARKRIGTLVQQKREFRLEIINVYEVFGVSYMIIEVDISDPLFQQPPKALSPIFYVKFNDQTPKLYYSQANYTTNKAHLTLYFNEVPQNTTGLRLLIWHQVGNSVLTSKARIGSWDVYLPSPGSGEITTIIVPPKPPLPSIESGFLPIF